MTFELSGEWVGGIVALAVAVVTVIWRISKIASDVETIQESVKIAHTRIDERDDKFDALTKDVHEIKVSNARIEEKIDTLQKQND